MVLKHSDPIHQGLANLKGQTVTLKALGIGRHTASVLA